MQPDNMIPAQEFCMYYDVDAAFISQLQEYGLVELSNIDETVFVPVDQFSNLERMIRLHYDLNINLEGLDAINEMLKRIESMQSQLTTISNKLRLYESGSLD